MSMRLEAEKPSGASGREFAKFSFPSEIKSVKIIFTKKKPFFVLFIIILVVFLIFFLLRKSRKEHVLR